MIKELKEIIPPPGQFILLNFEQANNYNKRGRPGKKLDIFKSPSTAKKVYKIYRKCWDNSCGLIQEAKILLKNSCFSRSVALGITAWEELGKSQIAADYYSGLLEDTDYKEAFKNHKFKTSYLARNGVLNEERKFGLAVFSIIGEKLEKLRQNALYVSEQTAPEDLFKKEDAEFIIERIEEHISYIIFAEEFNGRIGSKALFK